MSMRKWLSDLVTAPAKKALPILSFPSVSLMGVSVRELISSSDLQAEGMCRIAAKCDAAAAVSLMDLSVEAECFGAAVRFSDNEVPTVTGRLICDLEEAAALQVPQVGTSRSGIYIDAVAKAAERIKDRPIFAGMIGPFSLAARLLDVTEVMFDCYDEPEMVHTVLEKATAFLIDYARAYKSVGADGILLAEPVAGLLSPMLEAEFSAPYVKRIVDAVQGDDFLLVYHNCGDNTPAMVKSILSTGSAAYHFGNSIDMAAMLGKFPANVPVMGNVDPAAQFRLGTPDSVRNATLGVMEKCCGYPNFIISSGCDIPPATPWENVDAFFNAVKEFYDGRK